MSAFGAPGSLSARLNERQAEAKVVIDLEADVVDLTDPGVDPA